MSKKRLAEEEMFRCQGCGCNTLHIQEYYMVLQSVWLRAAKLKSGMLCIGCLETRLGRELERSDFIDAPVNQGIFPMSARLASRIVRGAGPLSPRDW